MTFDVKAIAESKRRYRRKLAALPVAEKLRMLEGLRERELSLAAVRLTALQARSEPVCADQRISIDTLHERSASPAREGDEGLPE